MTLSGRLSTEDYARLSGSIREAIAEHGKVRLLIELDHWDGWEFLAAVKNIFFAFMHSFSIERVAFIMACKSDKRMVLLDQPFHSCLRKNTRYFSKNDIEGAEKWLAEDAEA